MNAKVQYAVCNCVETVYHFTCTVCGEAFAWEVDARKINAIEPGEGEVIDCPKCEAAVKVKFEV